VVTELQFKKQFANKRKSVKDSGLFKVKSVRFVVNGKIDIALFIAHKRVVYLCKVAVV